MENVQQVHKRTETDKDRRTVIHWCRFLDSNREIVLHVLTLFPNTDFNVFQNPSVLVNLNSRNALF